VATIRDCFLIDLSLYADLDVIYCGRLKIVQDQLKKYRLCYIKEVPNIIDKVIYTSDIIMGLKKAFKKLRKLYIPPNVPKLVVDS
jgi:hypothetical protein